MPDTGAPWALRFPAVGEQADVPADMGELAADVHEALTALAAEVDAIPDPTTPVPYRMAAGAVSMPSVSAGTGATVQVTFPVGRFTVPPIVTVASMSSGYAAGSAGPPSATGFSARFWALQGTPSTPTVHWHAVQMTALAAAG